MNSSAIPKRRLKREDWIESALELLCEAGIGSVSIEQLAHQLNVTRGSFYHHLADREDLLRSVLEYWADRWTYAIRDQLAVLELEPEQTLLALMRMIRRYRAADYDAPIRAWALHEPLAREVVEQVDVVRLGVIQGLFEALGFDGIAAENRARLYLYYEMAGPSMFDRVSTERDEALMLERLRFLTSR